MWLINTTTLELHEFIDAQHAPPYAILSHCWGESEVSFKDFRKKRHCTGPGYEKIVKCCEYARTVGHEGRSLKWAWIDTCCIDKRSSAELSEAINSMYEWYKRAAICYAYLADVRSNSFLQSDSKPSENTIAGSRWFTRGWTLQELLAPYEVLFLDVDWIRVGAKHDFEQATPLTRAIASTTGIPTRLLAHPNAIRGDESSSAQIMSWASYRRTTRKEDEAYCLFGLFGINMPLLYGEGNQAFQRLQHEILRHRHGFSLFAWDRSAAFSRGDEGCMLASTPSRFQGAGSINNERQPGGRQLITPKGPGFELHVPPFPQGVVFCHSTRNELLVVLGCEVHKLVHGLPRSSRCILHLDQLPCGHFIAWTHGKRVQCEEDIEDFSGYRALQASGSVYVHASLSDASQCRRCDLRCQLIDDGDYNVLALAQKEGAFKPECARVDAERFRIQ